MSERIAIVGASVRAAAASAVRAGFQVVAADLFADADLCEIADATQLGDYPYGFVSWLESLSPKPAAWLYTGALENYPELVDELVTIAPLWGNAGDVLRRVRSPWLTADALRGAGLLFPETRPTSRDLPWDGSWLAKTGRGASGSGVAEWRGQEVRSDAFFQQRVPGVPCSATFVATGGKSQLLGVVRQLIGEPWLHAREYQFSGAIGPWKVTKAVCDGITLIGDLLASRFALRGVFGVDLMIDDEQLWTIEVNPRFPSSAEVVECMSGRNVFAALAGPSGSSALTGGLFATGRYACGKAILFARDAVEVTRSLQLSAQEIGFDSLSPALADIPRMGTRIRSAQPVVTLFARGATCDEVAACLKARVAIVEQHLYA